MKKKKVGVPIVAQQKWIWLESMRMQVWSQALLSGLRIWCCCEPWCRSKMWLRYDVAVAVSRASTYSSDSTPCMGTSICHKCCPKKTKKNAPVLSMSYCLLTGPTSNYLISHESDLLSPNITFHTGITNLIQSPCSQKNQTSIMENIIVLF